ncbi:hypothetical protein MLPF_1488 [Mycobacterium lepromatosis]|nr:hypothetical protein MLPF_1488 [Mycobacterium lepromatosis]
MDDLLYRLLPHNWRVDMPELSEYANSRKDPYAEVPAPRRRYTTRTSLRLTPSWDTETVRVHHRVDWAFL